MMVSGRRFIVRNEHGRPCGQIITRGRVELTGYDENAMLVVTGRSGHLYYEDKNEFFRSPKGEELCLSI